jgi:hypothetical protein
MCVVGVVNKSFGTAQLRSLSHDNMQKQNILQRYGPVFAGATYFCGGNERLLPLLNVTFGFQILRARPFPAHIQKNQRFTICAGKSSGKAVGEIPHKHSV